MIYKLERLGIYGKFYGLALSFLSDRNQTVALNTQSSNCFHIEAGVPQGSILGPLLFLIYINDLTEELTSVTKLLADNIPLFQLCMTLKQHLYCLTFNCQEGCSNTVGYIPWQETEFVEYINEKCRANKDIVIKNVVY